MYLRRNFSTVKYFTAFTICVLIYCEWIIYYSRPMHWNNLKCTDSDACTKILFVADPQIQGDLAVPAPLNYIFNWDSDRFLKSTYSVVYKYFKPDIIVFLGDLMDEGSISSNIQYAQYAQRLFNIFHAHSRVMMVWIPGDNDIGGENEPIKQDKLKAFHKIFGPSSSIVKYPGRNLTLYKVNGITYSYPQNNINSEDNDYRIVISHYPVTQRQMFAKKVNDAIHPHVYFCAHDHTSKYVHQTKQLDKRATRHLIADEVLDIYNDDSLYEIYVPTCSYRMGTDAIGFGVAVLEPTKHMRYAVYWSPGRFNTLFIYLGLATLTVILFIVFFITKILFFFRKRILVYAMIPLSDKP